LQDASVVWREHAFGFELRVLASSPARPAHPAITAALESEAAAGLRVLVVERPHPDDDVRAIAAHVQARCRSLRRLEWGAEGFEVRELELAHLLAGELKTRSDPALACDLGGVELPDLEELSLNGVASIRLADAALPVIRCLRIALRLPAGAPPVDVAEALRTSFPRLAELRIGGVRDGSTWARSAAGLFHDPARLLSLPFPQLATLSFGAPFDRAARDALFASPLLAQLSSLSWGMVVYEGDERARGVTAPGVETELSCSQRDQLLGKTWWLGVHAARTGIVQGARVEHPRFGRGIVLDGTSASPDAQVLVEFDDGRRSRLVSRFLRHLG
jgi:hypothetical protein